MTGLGFGVGRDVDPWANLLDGRSEVQAVDLPLLGKPAAGASPRFANPELSGSAAMMASAVDRAQRDSLGPLTEPWDPERCRGRFEDERCGWVLGVSKSDPAGWCDDASTDWMFPGLSIQPPAEPRGPRITPVAACATGVVAVIRGVELIQRGLCDRVVCGAADASLHPLVLASFARLGVLAKPGGDPATCVRPFDVGRNGFAIGEGAAAFVLERADLVSPGTSYATMTGSAIASAAVKLTDVDSTGDPVRRVLRECTAGVPPDLLGLHGTATRANDPAEAAGVRTAFQNGAAIAAFASKGATGHQLGAAGAMELAFTLLALRDGIVPPTVNLRQQDPACGLNLSPDVRRASLQTAAKVSLGFGGTVAGVALRRGDRLPSPSFATTE
ncbi:hypothetical protein LzC2_20520 [Planctomycetes bacterium LzC2]|uniref:Ketosynthase family 3 (KS3) domain-containing protein n=1 Tax=Alienimonas chondri TaxID=2681879 RepID=A0ABX1VFC5_9PLAN|nr:hypothetical protein [Alienimonas chondri]